MSLETDIVQFLKGERKPTRRQELCALITRAAVHNPAWPKATYEQWNAAIAKAISLGLIQCDGQTVWLPKSEAKPKSEQLDLF